ncbi:hypothetical protein BGC_04940 [Burkholderia sp. 3C]
MIFRKLVIRPVRDTFRESVSPGDLKFRSRFRYDGGHFQTLSDKPGDVRDGVQANPIGAMPHENLSQLREREIDRMTRDIDRLRNGCLDELRFWRGIRAQMIELAHYKPSFYELKLVKGYLLQVNRLEDIRGLRKCADEAIISSVVRLISDVNFPRYPLYKGKDYDSLINERIFNLLNIPKSWRMGVPAREILYLTQFALSREVVAAFYPILSHTRFNGSSLREVTRDKVKLENGIFTLQGFKSRVDQDTPIIDITKENMSAYEAIELVLWNFEQIKRFGHIFDDEQRLWFAWPAKSRPNYQDKMKNPITYFDGQKKNLLTRIGMDWFGDSQVRTHMLVLDRISSDRTIRAIRDGAGHKSESTTGAYFMNATANYQSSSMNLEFQRRIDATIKFAISEEQIFFADKFDPNLVDDNLLFPIGDGTGCEAPFDPPEPRWLTNGICDAKNCHAGEGCKRNKLIIGKKRVEEVWLTSWYYAKRWRSLLSENEEAFHKWHAPAMLFNISLKAYIRSSSYWSVIEPIVRSLNEGRKGA